MQTMLNINHVLLVNTGDYIQAVCDRNEAENISRVLYPNDNVSLYNFSTPSSDMIVLLLSWV